MRADLVTGFKYAGQKAVCLHVPNLRSALRNRHGAWVGFFVPAAEVIGTPSFEVNFEISQSRRKAWPGRSLLNLAERDGERAEKNRERQCPETELDFQGGPGGTTGDESGHASEGQACSASDFMPVKALPTKSNDAIAASLAFQSLGERHAIRRRTEEKDRVVGCRDTVGHDERIVVDVLASGAALVHCG